MASELSKLTALVPANQKYFTEKIGRYDIRYCHHPIPAGWRFFSVEILPTNHRIATFGQAAPALIRWTADVTVAHDGSHATLSNMGVFRRSGSKAGPWLAGPFEAKDWPFVQGGLRYLVAELPAIQRLPLRACRSHCERNFYVLPTKTPTSVLLAQDWKLEAHDGQPCWVKHF
jgi:hypothetical protein